MIEHAGQVQGWHSASSQRQAALTARTEACLSHREPEVTGGWLRGLAQRAIGRCNADLP